jgi:predicted RNase H-like HicB family nuclease
VVAVTEATYRVVYERDESGSWIARVPAIRGCHTHGRTLDQARRRIREALALSVDDAPTAELDEDVRLPVKARLAVARSRHARHEAERIGDEAREATREAVRTLVQDAHLGLRDAGELLGLSHQRIQQLARGALKGQLVSTSELRARARSDEANAEARRQRS